MAQWNAKGLRREMHLLSKLQSVSAWRGAIVDSVIGDVLVPAWNKGRTITTAEAVREARRRYDLQLEFAKGNRLRESGMTATKGGDAFAAFYAVEYKQAMSEDELAQAWTEIRQSLTNLFAMQKLQVAIKSGRYRIAQRQLRFPLSGVTVLAVPDLIVFNDHSPPFIVDWKVHSFGTHDYRMQLAVYALAVTRCKPNIDFPRPDSAAGSAEQLNWAPDEVRLVEAQLLIGRARSYKLSEEDVQEVETFIAVSAAEMKLALGRAARDQLNPFDFPVTEFPEACQTCPFRVLCWEAGAYADN